MNNNDSESVNNPQSGLQLREPFKERRDDRLDLATHETADCRGVTQDRT
jgi:hypothetical protein